MRPRFATVVVAAAAVLCSVPATGASARGPGVLAASDGRAGGWGAAGPVSGSGAVSPAWITSVSCAWSGNCSAGGFFYDSSGNQVALIVDDRHGTWGIPQAVVRGRGPASGSGLARIESVSCASAGNCGASGFFTTPGVSHDFVVDEKHGRWGAAEPVPGVARLNRGTGGTVEFGPVSCASAGNCSAAGSYDRQSSLESGLYYERVFVVTETGGTWGQAQQVPGLTRLDNNSYAQVASVSCPTAGNCTAGGAYGDPREIGPAFAVTETNGTWGRAQQIPGPAPGLDAIASVSCPSAGNCVAGGTNLGRNGTQAFVVSQQHGTWGRAAHVRGLPTRAPIFAQVRAVSCPSAGYCAAGGLYSRADGSRPAFVVSETNGTWGRATQVLGLATPGDAEIDSLSCASAGNCSAGGQYYISATGATEVFVVSEKHGTWGTAIPVPGLIRLNTAGDAEISSMSCGAAGNCAAGGYYSAGSDGTPHAFVVSQQHGTWGSAHTFPAQRP
jgi:hypothetical protein